MSLGIARRESGCNARDVLQAGHGGHDGHLQALAQARRAHRNGLAAAEAGGGAERSAENCERIWRGADARGGGGSSPSELRDAPGASRGGGGAAPAFDIINTAYANRCNLCTEAYASLLLRRGGNSPGRRRHFD